jgi:anti-sigma B factor antagonist
MEEAGGYVVARAQGPVLDAVCAGDLKRALVARMSEGGTSLVLDLSAVMEIDSSGLGALVAVLKAARLHGGTFEITGVQPGVGRVMGITRLDRVLTIRGCLEEAVEVPAGRQWSGTKGRGV